MDPKEIAELCCGPGGMALGFSPFFHIVHAIDKAPEVVKTYAANHPETQVRRQDIRLMTGTRGDFQGLTGIIGGPPCQGSSVINTKRRSKWQGAVDLNLDPIEEDPRNNLMNEFMRLVDEIRPEFFVMENVPGVPRERKTQVIQLGEASGYVVTSKFLNASQYGAAQTRERWIVVGLRGRPWVIPEPVPARTVRQAFSGLVDRWGQMQSRPDTIERLGHSIRGEWIPMDSKKKFKGMIRLDWDRPAPAVVNLKKVYMVHPDEDRNISLSEAAALQGFPHSYIWHGTQTQIAQMIANAMPSEMAAAIAGSI